MFSFHSSVELEKGYFHGCIGITVDSQRHTWNNDTCNRQEADIPHGCHEAQGLLHSKDEGPMSRGPSRARRSSCYLHDDNYTNLACLQVSTLPSILNVIQALPSQDVFQRVRAAPKATVRPSSPLTQATQQGSRPPGIQNLLNPVEGKDHANAGCERPGGTNTRRRCTDPMWATEQNQSRVRSTGMTEQLPCQAAARFDEKIQTFLIPVRPRSHHERMALQKGPEAD